MVPSVLDGVRVLKGCEANVSAGLRQRDRPARRDSRAGSTSSRSASTRTTGFDVPDRARNTEALLRGHGEPARRPDHASRQRGRVPARPRRDRRGGGSPQRHPRAQRPQLRPARARAPASTAREREFAAGGLAAGAPVSIGSDAHYALHVGRFDTALAVAEELGLRRGPHRQPRRRDACSRTCSASASARGSTPAACGSGPSTSPPTRSARGAGGSPARAQEPADPRLRADDASAS